MVEAIGAIVMLVSLIVLVLPLITFLRLHRLTGDLTQLATRVQALEDALRRSTAASERPRTAGPSEKTRVCS